MESSHMKEKKRKQFREKNISKPKQNNLLLLPSKKRKIMYRSFMKIEQGAVKK